MDAIIDDISKKVDEIYKWATRTWEPFDKGLYTALGRMVYAGWPEVKAEIERLKEKKMAEEFLKLKDKESEK